MEVYLAGPIGSMTIAEANVWREAATQFLAQRGIKALNPLRGKLEKDRGTYTPAEIVLRDKNDIACAEVTLVYWPEKCTSNGTAMEIEYAHAREKIILFVGEWGKNDIWINYHVTKFMNSIEEALDYIAAMFN